MEPELNEMVQELGDAIHETLAESARVGEIIDELERAGFDVQVVLEFAIRLSAKEKLGTPDTAPPKPAAHPAGSIHLTAEDEEFLRALKVKV